MSTKAKVPSSFLRLSTLSLLISSSFSFADDSALEKRLSELEARLSKLEHALAQKDKHIEKLEIQLKNDKAAKPPLLTYQQDKPAGTHDAEFKQRPSHQYKAPERSIRLSGTDTRLQIGGHIWLDAIYNSGEMTNRAGFQPSSIAYEKNTVDDNTLLNVGQSKLYFKSYTPTQYGEMKTRFEFDMFQSDGSAAFNLHHLWAELGSFGAGQTFTGFMDIDAFPNIIDYWGPNSMVFSRQPQVRYTFDLAKGSQFAVSLERSDSDFAYPAELDIEKTLYDEVNELPDVAAFYLKQGTFGHFKSSFILRKLGYETPLQSDETLGWGINLSGSLILNARNSIKYQVVHGDGISRYINDPCCSVYSSQTGGSDAGLNAKGDLEAITATGGFIYLDHQWQDDMSSSVGLSVIALDNLSTQFDNAFKQSIYSSANFIWLPTEMSKVGVEVLYGEVENKFGTTADNFRLQTSFGFKY